MKEQSALVSVKWLNEHLLDSNLILLDASLTIDKSGQEVSLNLNGIPGALQFNVSELFSDQKSKYPNMFPQVNDFELQARKLGINQDTTIVVYDQKGIYSSARAWWMFKVLGHKNIYVLNGGLPAWVEKGLPVQSLKTSRDGNGNFIASKNSELIWNYNQVKLNINLQSHQVIDARSRKRFLGLTQEPRPNTKSGHIPHSKNLHYQSVLHNGYLKPEEEIKALFSSLKLNDKPIVFTCGSGITACILYLATYMYLPNKAVVYDGSWTEWGEREDTQITTYKEHIMLDELKENELREIESQLSLPKGEGGVQMAKMMNETNIKMTLDSISALEIREGEHILEMGHGNCDHLKYILDQTSKVQFYGLELSETMFQEAKKLNETYINEKCAAFYLYDGKRIPLESQVMDKIFTVNTLYFWSEPLDMLEELYRVLKPNGRLVITFAKEAFMNNLPFVRDKFNLYSNQKALDLVKQSNFKVYNILDKEDIVKSKHGELVERKFSVLILEK